MKSLIFEYTNETGERTIRDVVPLGLTLGITPHITEPEWLLEASDIKKNETEYFVLKNIQRMIDHKVQRFLCVTVYVINEEKKFLMLLNRKLGKWVPPGGKVDRDETPDEAAVRECFEETGIVIDLIGEKAPVEGGLMTPFGSQLNTVIPAFRDHVDLIYLGIPHQEQRLKISDREASDIGWFSLDDVLKLDTFLSVKQWCNFFVRSPQ